MSLSKITLGLGVAAAVGFGVYLLSRDGESVKFDKKNHKISDLHEILDDIYLEYACAYIFYYNLIQNQGAQGQLTEDKLEAVRDQIERYTKGRDEYVCKKYKISTGLLEKWIEAEASDYKVQKTMKDLKDLLHQVLDKQHVEEIHYEVPPEMTKETYVQVIRKVLGCVRREAYFKIQEKLVRTSRDKVTADEVEEILDEIAANSQEHFREQALKLYSIPVPQGEVPKKLMQRAYLVFSTERQPPSTFRKTKMKFQDQISQEHQVHSQILAKIQNGERVDGIEKDPLLDKGDSPAVSEAHHHADPGVIQKVKDESGEDQLQVQPHEDSLKQVEDLLSKRKDNEVKEEAKEEEVVEQKEVEHVSPNREIVKSEFEDNEEKNEEKEADEKEQQEEKNE